MTFAEILLDVGRVVRTVRRSGVAHCQVNQSKPNVQTFDATVVSKLDFVFQQAALDWVDYCDTNPGIVFRAIVEEWKQDAVLGAMGAKIVEMTRRD